MIAWIIEVCKRLHNLLKLLINTLYRWIPSGTIITRLILIALCRRSHALVQEYRHQQLKRYISPFFFRLKHSTQDPLGFLREAGFLVRICMAGRLAWCHADFWNKSGRALHIGESMDRMHLTIYSKLSRCCILLNGGVLIGRRCKLKVTSV